MKYLERELEIDFDKFLQPNKVLVLMGARRVGKTELLKKKLSETKESYLLLNGEDAATVSVLNNRSVENYKRLLGDKKLLVIDEAQTIPEIGKILKLMVDEIEGIKIIATGSSVFDLENELGEPLTGRDITVRLFQLSQMEFNKQENLIETKGRLEERLILGSYPELQQYNGWDEKVKYLERLVSSYLIRDILAFEKLKKPDKIIGLLRLIAFQIGGEVSLPELGQKLGIDKNTVDRYLDLLTKVFVLYKVNAYSMNPRKEISKSSRWYFYDNGIRNALIANVNSLELRNDHGQLWENYLVSERLKYQSYNGMLVNNYFWRTYSQQEIDWVENRGGKIYGYEFKWNSNKVKGAPAAWKNMYPNAEFMTIHPNNYLDFIS
ncbi:MAG: ATPase [Flavobacteriales bacterium CG18_big_fil_WC_8_21_14_2_50_32_9]|nr:MAG: ATPase [Flavobacteriales bacterium CG18_big_fil_WC_8_21_14_2_50_32_9]